MNSGNILTISIKKAGKQCFGAIRWSGSVSGTSATLTDFTIPDAFCPLKTEFYSTNLISAGKILGSLRFDVSSLGKITYVTDQEGFVERHISFSYISNNFIPDEKYLIVNL